MNGHTRRGAVSLTPWALAALRGAEPAQPPEGYRMVLSGRSLSGPYTATVYGPDGEVCRVTRRVLTDAIDEALAGVAA